MSESMVKPDARKTDSYARKKTSGPAGVLRRAAVLPLRFYQRFISPLKGVPSCRFSPTCSQYAVEAILEWGVLRGGALAVWRLLRCNPFGRGGFDPVPKRKNDRIR